MIIYLPVFKEECDCWREQTFLNERAFSTYEEAVEELKNAGYIEKNGRFTSKKFRGTWAEIQEIGFVK